MLSQSNKIDFKGQHIYVGIDVHLKSWNATVMTEELTIKTFSQNPSPEVLHQFLTRNFPNAIYHTACAPAFLPRSLKRTVAHDSHFPVLFNCSV